MKVAFFTNPARCPRHSAVSQGFKGGGMLLLNEIAAQKNNKAEPCHDNKNDLPGRRDGPGFGGAAHAVSSSTTLINFDRRLLGVSPGDELAFKWGMVRAHDTIEGAASVPTPATAPPRAALTVS